jgi:hydroxyacylglutathione hydrolase
MRIIPVPCLKDNYAYLVVCEATGRTAVVDPSEAEPVLAAASREGLTIEQVWNTHHHHDHVGGNQGVVAAFPGIEVVAHASDRGRVPGQTRFVEEGDEVTLGELRGVVIHNPAHTTGAISYHLIGEPGALFTGDTMFGAGCGRLFEGTPADMFTSLGKLAVVPPETRVYCGHEYTASNLGFAAAAEPDNPAVSERRARVDQQRAAGQPTVPFTIRDELATNPFVRAPTAERLGELRAWKDRF